jgi:ribosomal-protein-alanine N-acetyltransferase
MDRNVPALTLTTEHLVLRPVGAADNEQLLAHWTSPQVRQFMVDGAVLSAAEVSAKIADSSASFTAAGYGLWLISQRQAAGLAEMAGTAGLRPLEDLGLEIIWSLAPAVWGRGYAIMDQHQRRCPEDHLAGGAGAKWWAEYVPGDLFLE